MADTTFNPFADSPLAARITAHRGFLIFHAREGDFPGLLHCNERRVGTTVVGTVSRLGISDEAIELLRKVKVGNDGIGDVMWWPGLVAAGGADNGDGTEERPPTFGWLGLNCEIKNPQKIEGDRYFGVPEWQAWVTIPNESDPEAVAVVDAMLKGSAGDA